MLVFRVKGRKTDKILLKIKIKQINFTNKLSKNGTLQKIKVNEKKISYSFLFKINIILLCVNERSES